MTLQKKLEGFDPIMASSAPTIKICAYIDAETMTARTSPFDDGVFFALEDHTTGDELERTLMDAPALSAWWITGAIYGPDIDDKSGAAFCVWVKRIEWIR